MFVGVCVRRADDEVWYDLLLASHPPSRSITRSTRCCILRFAQPVRTVALIEVAVSLAHRLPSVLGGRNLLAYFLFSNNETGIVGGSVQLCGGGKEAKASKTGACCVALIDA